MDELAATLRSAIAASPLQRITFADYMDLVLYHPQYGYYASSTVNIGSQGDFFTSPHLCADFGEVLAEQFVQMWDILGRPKPFTLVEMGGGQGLLAADVLGYLQKSYPQFFDVLEYVIVEKAPGLIAQQQQMLQDWITNWGRIYWRSWEEIPSASITGCCFSNELVDALPVHQFVIEGGQLREIYVTANDNFAEVIGELSTLKLTEYFKLVGIELPSSAYADGYRSEVNLAALDWLGVVAEKLNRGYLLTIDYGYSAVRYYNPQRSRGTLQCYYKHRHHDNPYINIGQQDITAHVDFTALERWGELCGLQRVGFTHQGMFLMALGMGDRIANLASSCGQDIQKLLRRRDALHQLIDPAGLGRFGVLVQSKGLKEQETLRGLSMP